MAFNSTIKQRTGICPLCTDNQDKPLIKGLCHTHYWNAIKMKSVEKQSIKLFEDEDLSGLIHDCDVLFSRWIRLKYSHVNINQTGKIYSVAIM